MIRDPSEVLALLKDAEREPNADLRRLQLTVVHAAYVKLWEQLKRAEKDFAEWTAQWSGGRDGAQ